MPVIVTRNFGPLTNIQLSTPELMREIGLQAIEIIRRRTRAGMGVEGPFPRYSPGYAAWKAQAVGGGGTVNLTLSGRMLNDLTITRVTATEVELGFKS